MNYTFHRRRKGYLSEKQVGHGAILLAILDVAVTLVFAHIGEAYHVSVFDWRLLLAATLVCFGLFKYGQHIVHHSNKLYLSIKQPRPVKYGTTDFRVIIGRLLTKMETAYEMRMMKYSYHIEENTRSTFSNTVQKVKDWKAERDLKNYYKKQKTTVGKPLLSTLLGLSV